MKGYEMILKTLESMRMKVIYYYIGVVVAGIASFILFVSSNWIWGIIGAIGAFFLLIVGYSKQSNYKNKVKEILAVDIFQNYFDDVTFQAEKGFDEEFIRNTEMIGLGNIYSSNDLLEGTYKNIRFQQSDLLIQRRQSTGKSSVTITLFKGQYRIYEFNKNFTSYLQIRDKENSWFKNAKPYQFFTQREETKHLKLESLEFNNMFDVYASDDHEAFYILTPHFMEKVIELNKRMDCQILIGFIDNKLHIASYTSEDLYEPSIWDQIDESYFAKVEEEIKMIIEIIDVLDLDRGH